MASWISPSHSVLLYLLRYVHCSYEPLKKTIYELENAPDKTSHHERTALLSVASANEKFIPLLDRELDKIVSFYRIQEEELRSEVEVLDASITKVEEEGPGAYGGFSDEGESDDDDEVVLTGVSGASRNTSMRRKRSISASSPTNGRRRLSSGEYPCSTDTERSLNAIPRQSSNNLFPRTT